MFGYCSWCFQRRQHFVVEKNMLLRRNVYKCTDCGNHTLICRTPGCKHFAQGHPADSDKTKCGSMIDKLKRDWHAEYCVEHDGTIASFERLDMQLESLKDFYRLFDDRKTNMVKVTASAGMIVGGIAVFGLTAGMGGPAIAAAAGKTGLLGAASTGTAISSLSGAALSSASLAAIGGGTMAAGMLFVTAAGSALGSVMGGVLSNRYFGEIKDFDILQYNEGDGPEVLFVNGFLSQDNDDLEDWRAGARQTFKQNPWHLVTWESKTKADLGKLIYRKGAEQVFAELGKRLAAKATKNAGKKLNPLSWATFLADLAGNDWHTAMAKAGKTGILLADLIARTPNKKFILVGHSLGARVIYYALEALSTRTKKPQVIDAILLGGAVGSDDELGWEHAAKAVSGKIYNCLSLRDDILNYAYRGASGLFSNPIGISAISKRSRKIENWDCTDFIGGHMEWKQKLGDVLEAIEYKLDGR